MTGPFAARASVLEPDGDPALNLLEVTGLLGTLGLVSVGTVSLALAQAGHFGTPQALLLSLALFAALVTISIRLGGRPAVTIRAGHVVALLLLVVVGGVAFLPGFPYAFGDKDPGVYVIHAFGIERTGDVDVPDEAASRAVAADIGITSFETDGRYPGLRIDRFDEDGVTTTTDFLHFVPATLALAVGLGGTAAIFNVTPLIAIVSLVVIAAAAHRALGPAAAALTALLLTANAMQVWQAKMPSTEIPMQLVVSGALLAILLSMTTAWTGASFLAGVFVGATFLIRPDGFLVVALAAGFCAVVIALGRADRRVWAGLAGSVVTLPFAAYTAYGPQEAYSETNGVPSLPVLGGAILLVLGGAFVAQRFLESPRGGAVRRRAGRMDLRIAGGVVVLLAVVVGVLAWNRESWFGPTMGMFGDRPIPTYNERNLLWLSYFVTVPGLFLMVGGLAVLGFRRRWSALAWVLVTPGIAVLPIYLYESRISPRLMWWVRRYVPLVLPALLILVAVALVWWMSRRSRLVAVAGLALTVWLLTFSLGTSRPFWSHREFAGSHDAARALAEATHDAGMVLVARDGGIIGATRNLPSVAWLVFGTPSVYLPSDPDRADDYVEAWAEEADGPIYLMTEDPGEVPDGLDERDWELTESFRRGLPFWHETSGTRPVEEHTADQTVAVWRYEPVSGTSDR